MTRNAYTWFDALVNEFISNVLCEIYKTWNCCWRGEEQLGKEPFREWYGRVGELRSLVPAARFLLMTATASCSVRQTIWNKFGSLDVQEIVESPDRVNIKLHMQKFSSCLSNAELLQSLIDNLTKRKHECCRVLIFCQSVSDCGKLYVTFVLCIIALLC